MAGYIQESNNTKMKIISPYEDKEVLNNIKIKSEIIPKIIVVTKYES